MQFKAIPLEVLGEEHAFSRLLVGCRGNGIPKDGEPVILLLRLAEASLNTVVYARHVETEARFGHEQAVARISQYRA